MATIPNDPRFVDLTGQTFGMLTVTGYSGHRRWDCQCRCGKQRNVYARNLLAGKTRSCGCYRATRVDPRFVDLTGRIFGLWTVLSHYADRRWRCVCICGVECIVEYSGLTSGNSKSCGCRGKARGQHFPGNEKQPKPKKVRPEPYYTNPAYSTWGGMCERCYSKNHDSYHRYGGRGITVCDRWRHSFPAFLIDMGPRPSIAHSIDRFPNRDGNYEPGNCRWATSKQQSRNRGDNRLVTVNGETRCISEWCEITGLLHHTIQARLNAGWSPEDAVLKPLHTRFPKRSQL